ncbi:alpha/beta hydrolase [Flavilitoribacter nigricans]|uniref:Alpha/beta hydrolase n=1 Tax=Flavilitoribacter nigricans (strain ATCC 23147 / DSM 23189 / NBRC 102662 / NCIMB 1420 / SS-2) TaxID=1122177 RepID=A0A2D0N9H3_FLAN2|nr:alpha/beta hydrolase [Flavilitoribacter nigricans]PHN05172.1 alpha/beta hydrolase [Flavilitoribacter nigricans DSM 23189 = NBRC 102662]
MFNHTITWVIIVLLIIVITYFVGPVPPKPVYSTEWPKVPADFSELEAYIAAREDSLPVRKDNQARILWHDSIPRMTEYSFVYLHGFSGSYRDGYPVNVNVADTFGANIYLARWADHGLRPSHSLEHFTPETAWESAREALAIGSRIGKKVIVMSTSTGGTLGFQLAAKFPDSVFALINMSPNLKDDVPGTFLLNSPWGMELAMLVSLGDSRELQHEEPEASQYWDTIYPARALVNLQALVSTVVKKETFEQVTCPVQTLYYHKNMFEEDERVEVNKIPRVHKQLATPAAMEETVALDTPGTHFIGSDIKSKDYRAAQREIIRFCREKLQMKVK